MLAPAAPARADWLVYVGGGVQKTEGAWEVRGGQVLFHSPNGTLLAIRLENVDLPASEFLTWQLQEGRRRSEASALVQASRTYRGGETVWPGLPGFVPQGTPCTPAKVGRVLSADTLELVAGERSETVHVACLAAPQVQQRFAELSWFGRQSADVLAGLAKAGQPVCLVEEQPAQKDAQGHRRLYVELPDGRDLTAEILGRGLGVLRNGPCSRVTQYKALADQAHAEERGHWGMASLNAALAVLASAPILGAGPPLNIAPGGG